VNIPSKIVDYVLAVAERSREGRPARRMPEAVAAAD
jgi:hypothetical protein